MEQKNSQNLEEKDLALVNQRLEFACFLCSKIGDWNNQEGRGELSEARKKLIFGFFENLSLGLSGEQFEKARKEIEKPDSKYGPKELINDVIRNLEEGDESLKTNSRTKTLKKEDFEEMKKTVNQLPDNPSIADLINCLGLENIDSYFFKLPLMIIERLPDKTKVALGILRF